jgi:hypothetical protein
MDGVAKIVHHLSALGWGWTALFLLFDAVAIACAVFAIVRKRHKLAAFLGSGAATLGTVATSAAAQFLGMSAAFEANAPGRDPSQVAARMADGISTTMNAAAFGIVFEAVAGAACFACLMNLLIRSKAPPPSR